MSDHIRNPEWARPAPYVIQHDPNAIMDSTGHRFVFVSENCSRTESAKERVIEDLHGSLA
jgi:hypothetical protein